MRAALHKAVVSWPGTTLPNAIGAAGIFAGLYSDKVKNWINGMTVDQVHFWAAVAVCFGLAYWVLRLALRPHEKDTTSSGGQSTAGAHSHSIGHIGTANFFPPASEAKPEPNEFEDAMRRARDEMRRRDKGPPYPAIDASDSENITFKNVAFEGFEQAIDLSRAKGTHVSDASLNRRDTYTVTSHGSGPAIGRVDTLNVGPPRRDLNSPGGEGFKRQIDARLMKNRAWIVESLMGDAEGGSLKAQIIEYMRANGFDMGTQSLTSHIEPMVYGVRIYQKYQDGNGRIIIGHIPLEGSIWATTLD